MVVRNFLSTDAGNVALITAGSLSLLLFIAGAAIDYAKAVKQKMQLDTANDAAIIAGVSVAARARATGEEDWQQKGLATAQQLFAVNTTGIHTHSYTPTLTTDELKVTGHGVYSAASKNSLMQMFGYDWIDIDGAATASAVMGNFIDVHFVVDNSFSMGIGADIASQNLMYAANSGCALSCHHRDRYNTPTLTPSGARQIGAKLRIDVVREGTLKAIEELNLKLTGTTGRLRIGLYTFSSTLKTLAEPTTDIASVQTAARAIELDDSNYGGGTFATAATKALSDKLGTGGDGSSGTNRLSFVVLFTDGIDDSARMYRITSGQYAGLYDLSLSVSTSGSGQNWWPTSPARAPVNSTLQAFDPRFCSTIKSKKHEIYAIRVKYIVSPGLNSNAAARFIVDQLPNPLDSAFKACVSNPTNYVTAATSDDIMPAFVKIARMITQAKGVALTD